MISWPRKISCLDFIIWTIGFTSVAAQIVFMRECLTVFYGNEIAIGSLLCGWLVWTGLGSLLASKQQNPHKATLLLIQIGLAFSLPLTFLGIRASRMIFGITSGEIVGIGPIFLLVIGLLAPFCLLSGSIYPAVCQRLADQSGATNTAGRPYIIEAVGSGIGGIIASLLFLPRMEAAAILLGLFALNLLNAAVFCFQDNSAFPSRFLPSCIIILAMLALLPGAGKGLQRLGDRALWRKQPVLLSRNTAYGQVTFFRQNGQLSLYHNGLHAWSAPDRLTSEEAVHYTLLEHPEPRRVLLLGAGPEGALQEVLRHPSVTSLFYADPDEQLLSLIRRYLPLVLENQLEDPRIHILVEDGRAFLTRNADPFDAILLNMPSPYTAQINRYYSKEFFRLARKNLSPNGIFAISLQGSENLIGRELSDFLSAIFGTLQSVFPHCIVLPGETVRMIASDADGYLSTNADTLTERIRKRGLNTQYVQEYFLFDRLSPEREKHLKERLHPVSKRQINRDFFPIGYYYDAILWATYFSGATKAVYQSLRPLRTTHILVLLIGGLGILCLLALRKTSEKWRFHGVALSILSVGLTEISLVYALILGFQIICGHLYPHVAMIIAAYMMGLSIGAWRQNQRSDSSIRLTSCARIQAVMTLLPLAVMALLGFFHTQAGRLDVSWITLGFSTLIAFSGFIGGKQFILANQLVGTWNRSSNSTAGQLYGIDLIGSSGGVLVTSALFIPLLGLMDTLLILAVLNGLVALFLLAVDRGSVR